jgi:hypothetical protein
MAKKGKQKNSGTGQTVLLPAMFDNLTLRKDGSVSLKFDTREMTGEEISTLLGYRNTEGWLQFSQNNEFVAPPEDNAKLDDAKSGSQRIKDILYVMYMKMKEQGKITATFEAFKSVYYEKEANRLKVEISKLD